MTCPKDGGRQFRHCWMKMSDAQIASLTLSEIIALIKRLTEEIEVRAMELI